MSNVLDFILPIAFFFWGLFLGKRSRPQVPQEKDTSICSCSHVYSVHKEDGKCNSSIKTKRYDSIGNAVGFQYLGCACVRYDGIPPAHIYMKDS